MLIRSYRRYQPVFLSNICAVVIGFTEISNLFFEVIAEQNQPEVLKNLSIVEFTRNNAQLAFSKDNAKEKIPVDIKLSNGQTVKWDMYEIKSKIEKLKSNVIFEWATILFILGLISSITGIVLEIRKIRTNH